LLHQVDGTASAREFLHLAIVVHDRCEEAAGASPDLVRSVREDDTEQLRHATHEAQVEVVPGV